jgi:hypothetical protein
VLAATHEIGRRKLDHLSFGPERPIRSLSRVFNVRRRIASLAALDLWVMPLTGDRKPYPCLTTPFDETQGQFSPDGHWVAYHSNETGPLEVYVRPFPPSGNVKRVSTAGGASPRWRPDGRELFYLTRRQGDGGANQRRFARRSRRLISSTGRLRSVEQHCGESGSQYDVAADGRFLFNVTTEEAVARRTCHPGAQRPLRCRLRAQTSGLTPKA